MDLWHVSNLMRQALSSSTRHTSAEPQTTTRKASQLFQVPASTTRPSSAVLPVQPIFLSLRLSPTAKQSRAPALQALSPCSLTSRNHHLPGVVFRLPASP